MSRFAPSWRSLAVAAALGLAGCTGGGGGGDRNPGGDPPPPPSPRPTSTPTRLALHIAAMHVTQGTQTVDGAVPLVQDRDGCLRVFVLARSWQGPGPAVRVHVRDAHGHDLLDQEILPPSRGVPNTLRDAAPGESWDLPLPGRFIQPGNTIQATLEVPATDPHLEPGRRTFPQDGRPLRLDVRPVPPLRLTLIPIRTHGRLGRIEEGGRTLDSWVSDLRAMYPLARIDLQVGPVYETARHIGGPVDVFDTALEELEAWRLADGRNDNRYFYGVFPEDSVPAGGTMGIGYIGRPGNRRWRTALGHDMLDPRQPSTHYANVLAHELGHNFSRRHSPCLVSPYDPHYPRPDGYLDVCGFDLRTNRPVDPATRTDIMGYCPGRWVSRYTYEAVLNYRAGDSRARSRRLAAVAAQDGLLVWGRIQDGQVQLTSALRVHRTPLPTVPGDYRLECVDGSGQVVLSVPFAPEEVADRPDTAAFCVLLPMPPGGEAGLAELRVTRDGNVRAVLRPAAAGSSSAAAPKARRGADGVVQFTWDARAFPRVLVQERAGGPALALGADGHLDLRTTADALECTFSDGVRSIRHRVAVE